MHRHYALYRPGTDQSSAIICIVFARRPSFTNRISLAAEQACSALILSARADESARYVRLLRDSRYVILKDKAAARKDRGLLAKKIIVL